MDPRSFLNVVYSPAREQWPTGGGRVLCKSSIFQLFPLNDFTQQFSAIVPAASYPLPFFRLSLSGIFISFAFSPSCILHSALSCNLCASTKNSCLIFIYLFVERSFPFPISNLYARFLPSPPMNYIFPVAVPFSSLRMVILLRRINREILKL